MYQANWTPPSDTRFVDLFKWVRFGPTGAAAAASVAPYFAACDRPAYANLLDGTGITISLPLAVLLEEAFHGFPGVFVSHRPLPRPPSMLPRTGADEIGQKLAGWLSSRAGGARKQTVPNFRLNESLPLV